MNEPLITMVTQRRVRIEALQEMQQQVHAMDALSTDTHILVAGMVTRLSAIEAENKALKDRVQVLERAADEKRNKKKEKKKRSAASSRQTRPVAAVALTPAEQSNVDELFADLDSSPAR
jgi:regulator of replication initiation timing